MVSSATVKTLMKDGTADTKVVLVDGSKSYKSVSKNYRRSTALLIIVLAVVLFFGAVALSTAAFMRRTKEKAKSSKCSVAEVNLEQGEILIYRVEQKLEIRGGDVQKGTVHDGKNFLSILIYKTCHALFQPMTISSMFLLIYFTMYFKGNSDPYKTQTWVNLVFSSLSVSLLVIHFHPRYR